MESDAERLQNLRVALVQRRSVALDTVRVVVSPYRVCPLGAHIDHQHGPVLGMAIGLGTRLAYAPAPDAEVCLESADFSDEVRFSLSEVADDGVDWGRYARAAAAVLADRLPRAPRGCIGVLSGDLPGGGLSSSASVLVAYLLALADVNGLELSQRELVTLARRAENAFVGVQSGVLDPASVVGARRGQLLEIGTRDLCWRALESGAAAPETRFVVVFSGRGRNLARTPFNARVAECRAAAARIAAAGGLGPVDALGDLPEDLLADRLEDLPPSERGRARHFVGERDRVRRGVAAWERGDLVAFGRLMSESCRSSIENYETGSEEQREIQEILSATPGVLGSRFSGAGYGGCNVALVLAGEADAIGRRVLAEYRQRVPELAAEARAFAVDSVDGARIR